MADKTSGRKSAGQGSRGTSRSTAKNTGKSRRKKKNTSDDTMKLLLVLVIAGIAVGMIVFMQKNGEDIEPTGTQGTPVPTVSVGPTEGAVPSATTEPTKEPQPTEEAQPTQLQPSPSPAPTGTPSPEPTEAVPSPTPVAISPEDAEASIKQIVDTSIYKIELLNDHLGIEDREYYQYCISENGRELMPFLVVDKGSGSVWCYDASGALSECRKFPLDDVGNIGNSGNLSGGGLTADEAYEVLCTYTAEQLGLAKEVREYTPEYDSTLTLVMGVDCYRFNLTELSGGKVRNRGEFYISTDGKQCFYIDNDLGTFIPVP